ncbi:uncharacterized protein LOC111319543 [Stylophora pistillata]|uniref:uncharacterized protein LOC111319543 n=1 Tax=Stylophora pistillata TaxID=50429 RepID=UPI000C052EE9|nr:uncharacterized protein LOC111319543 [Stylophora pistillata]
MEIVAKKVKEEKEFRIICSEDFNATLAAKVRKAFSLPGVYPEVVENYTNKFLQKELLQKAGIPIPQYFALNILNPVEKAEIVFKDAQERLGIPFIIKPRDLYGTIGVAKISSMEELKHYFQCNDHYQEFILEEYIEGQLYHCDLFCQEGKYLFSEACEYTFNGLSFVKGKNHGSMPLQKEDPLREKIIHFCQKANNILSLLDGCSHHEVFVTLGNEIVFLESGPKPPRSFVPLIYKKMFGINLLNLSLLAEAGIKIKMEYQNREPHFWCMFPKKKGIVARLFMPKLKSKIVEFKWYVQPGQRINNSRWTVDRAGFAIVSNKDYANLKNDFQVMKQFAPYSLEEAKIAI